MHALADALVYAVAYIDSRDAEGDGSPDDDVEALETIASLLNDAPEEVRNALAEAAEKALDADQSGASRSDSIRLYESWMENMFGESWVGNKRQ